MSGEFVQDLLSRVDRKAGPLSSNEPCVQQGFSVSSGLFDFVDDSLHINTITSHHNPEHADVHWNTDLLCTIEKANSVVNKLILDGCLRTYCVHVF